MVKGEELVWDDIAKARSCIGYALGDLTEYEVTNSHTHKILNLDHAKNMLREATAYIVKRIQDLK